jgi:hypothetical protein
MPQAAGRGRGSQNIHPRPSENSLRHQSFAPSAGNLSLKLGQLKNAVYYRALPIMVWIAKNQRGKKKKKISQSMLPLFFAFDNKESNKGGVAKISPS